MFMVINVLVTALFSAVYGSSESFTDVVRIDEEAFKCSFQLVYSETALSLSPGRSNIWCGTELVARARKLFLLAPSGYRFSLLIDLNPTRIKKARVSVPTLTFARRRAGDPLGARNLDLAGPGDWDGER